jgi:hypothetical protein
MIKKERMRMYLLLGRASEIKANIATRRTIAIETFETILILNLF